MKTIPMIFNTEMVKALLDGRKTVTRRPMKPQPEDSSLGYDWWPSNKHGSMIQVSGLGEVTCEYKLGFIEDFIKEACPFGNVGDLIWVRETFRLYSNTDECGCCDCCLCPPNGTPLYYATHDDGESKWKPSIHMPRWASRLTLRITDVRIERVQDITEEQAKAEGVNPIISQWIVPESFVAGFGTVWNSIYSNWDKNPCVWVIEFEVIHKNVDEVVQ